MRSAAVGFSVGFLAAALAVVGELLGWFNCINAWIVETAIVTLFLGVVTRRFRTVVIGSSVLVTYTSVVSYVFLRAHHGGHWQTDDYLPVIIFFFLLVALPVLFAGVLDLATLRHARDDG